MSIKIRPAKADDIEALADMDHSYATEFVWQMDVEREAPQKGAHFREARLPRLMTVGYPRPTKALVENWEQRSALLVAEEEDRLLGYVSLSTTIAPGAAWVTDLVVNASKRRKGVGTQLLLAAQSWARQHGRPRVVLEMQSKNHPAIRFAQKLAFDFCGYNDRYYENNDIAVFFAKRLE